MTIQAHPTWPLSERFLLGFLAVLICLLSGHAGPRSVAAAVPGPCEPGYVQNKPEGIPFIRVALQHAADSSEKPVLLTWLGHSSFLLTSPAGLSLLIDPSAWHPLSAVPDVVTVSNLHGTHRAVESRMSTAQILWGMHPEQGWRHIVSTIQDVTLFNIPSYASREMPQDSAIHNSIFVFQVAGLCIVHLGNLRHVLTRRQLEQLGTPDVVMIPVDGQWTLEYGDMFTVIDQLQPRLVIPMHIETVGQAEIFARYTASRYAMRRLPGRTLVLSRSVLPARTEVVVFGDQSQ
ncbi:MAG: MBL fold metallo-hydrolase [Candidatus Tectomicrobia bacterium]|nr:MBL fold metallo-hydrolase [Candidatus Tectomicrobia bacterium]